ncbi:FAD-dependent oxidoreductase [Candidatus Tisiphia endosymbiont of Ditula angustiorana]|uniref:FAD-dependent oxidoreductase n=1 Tax=Candidatus Tisiphia endosymbiont of Ditula angustiorana TaxID=3066272 RepID=UPI00312C87BD
MSFFSNPKVMFYSNMIVGVKSFAMVLIFMLPTVYAQPQSEIRRIVPLKLAPDNLGQKIICYRPMRHDIPNMTVTKLGDKVIAHNYGHGGSGWTLAPGSVGYVNGLLQKSEYANDLKSNTPITIIGAGIIGLFTAYDLIEKGYNITIIADQFDKLDSNDAGAMFMPPSYKDSSTKFLMNTIGINSYKFYSAIAKKQQSNFIDGAAIIPTYLTNKEEINLEPYVTAGVMQPPKDVILDFGTGTTRKMVAYDDGILINVPKMMTSLTTYLKNKKVPFIKNKIQNFAEIKTKYILDCTGLGAKELNNDNAMTPGQGHLIMLKNQNPEDMKYVISIDLGKGKTNFGQEVSWYFYMHPKHLPNSNASDIGAIGGTFIEGATPQIPNEEQFDLIVERARSFYGIDASKVKK